MYILDHFGFGQSQRALCDACSRKDKQRSSAAICLQRWWRTLRSACTVAILSFTSTPISNTS